MFQANIYEIRLMRKEISHIFLLAQSSITNILRLCNKADGKYYPKLNIDLS